jgi:spore germination cell wall hydrolase CwlJ-like protein
MKKNLIATIILLGVTHHQKGDVNTLEITNQKMPELKKIEQFYTPINSQVSIEKKTINSEKNYQTDNFKNDSEEVLLARMILGEAEGCSKIEKIAIAYTAINRAKDKRAWNGETLKDSILMPSQYSCFNKKTDSSIFLKNPFRYNKEEFLNCLEISKAVLKKTYSDPTKGATHYYNPKKVTKPYWTKKLVKIGRIQNSYHIFYKE